MAVLSPLNQRRIKALAAWYRAKFENASPKEIADALCDLGWKVVSGEIPHDDGERR